VINVINLGGLPVHAIASRSKISKLHTKLKNCLAVSLVVLATLVASAAVPQTKASAIVNGQIVDYPWAVALVRPNDGTAIEKRTYCSGVLIKASWVLTAGHCPLQSNHSIVIGRGQLPSTAGGQVRYVSAWYDMRHSGNYCDVDRKEELCDIKLIKLSSPSTMEDADLAGSDVSSEWGVGSAARTYGYGVTSYSATQSSSYLRRANSTITDLRDNHYTLFSSSETSSVCWIDSGGPLIVSTSDGPKVVGITRAGVGQGDTCEPGSTNSYVKVGYRSSTNNSKPYLWIQSIVN
jgi:secreted trypsin-like serine protease